MAAYRIEYSDHHENDDVCDEDYEYDDDFDFESSDECNQRIGHSANKARSLTVHLQNCREPYQLQRDNEAINHVQSVRINFSASEDIVLGSVGNLAWPQRD